MNKTALLLAACLCPPALAAESFTLDSRHTFPMFEIDHMGFSVQRGRFNKTTGTVTLDAAAQTGKVEVNIDAASIDMGLDDWDKHMRNADFFNVTAFPSMTFSADTVRFEAGKPVAAEGRFTLLGVTRPLTMKIDNYRCGVHLMNRKTVCGAEASARIRRSEFGMTKFVPFISDEVRLVIPVEAFRD
ncbi:MAG: polyisoprenoid-binding protein [Betaproteobacteria bacterium]|nr:polyisoprenoid-binding protein [Betaproteobacteria bacterium]